MKGGGGGGGGKQSCLPKPRPDVVAVAFAIRESEQPELDPELVGLQHNDGMTFGTIDRRPRVSKLRGRLNDKGAALGTDGKFGGKTKEAVNGVQDTTGLPQTGVVDIATAAAIASETSEIVGLAEGDGLEDRTAGRRHRVKRLQQLLGSHGSFTKVDGMYGPKTQKALENFQDSVNLERSAIVDQVTADGLEGRADPPLPICEDEPILA